MERKWFDISKYACDRKRTKNPKFAKFVRAQYMQKEKAAMFEKVIFD